MSSSPIRSLIHQVLAGEGVTPDGLEAALHPILRGEATDVETSALLVALATQPIDGVTLAAAARVLRLHRVAVHPEVRPLIDTCGTGGDGAGTFNISTATAFVVAAAGAAVAKHGNRGVSSKVGSADVLESLGCNLELQAGAAKELLDAIGFTFLFAPSFHPAMRYVAPVRKALGVRTLFNLLGPLSNPALAEYQVLGVYDAGHTRAMAEALRELGSEGALVVHCEGMDELGLHGVTTGHRLAGGIIDTFELRPEDVGLARAPLAALAGGDSAHNASLLREAIAGAAGPRSDVVALNAGAALMVGGLVSTIEDGIAAARELMASGKVERVLQRYVESSIRVSKVAV